jgi:hypothetical protein
VATIARSACASSFLIASVVDVSRVATRSGLSSRHHGPGLRGTFPGNPRDSAAFRPWSSSRQISAKSEGGEAQALRPVLSVHLRLVTSLQPWPVASAFVGPLPSPATMRRSSANTPQRAGASQRMAVRRRPAVKQVSRTSSRTVASGDAPRRDAWGATILQPYFRDMLYRYPIRIGGSKWIDAVS